MCLIFNNGCFTESQKEGLIFFYHQFLLILLRALRRKLRLTAQAPLKVPSLQG